MRCHARKPKALNYALPLVRGEHIVVYDAEDIPEPRQLRLAADLFAAYPELMCLQSRAGDRQCPRAPLAALFAGEYTRASSASCCHSLPVSTSPCRWGHQQSLSHRLPEAARQVEDLFNVTEDADLGVRLARLKLKT